MKYTHDTLQFPSRVSHKLGVTFDAPRLSSNGGLALLSLMDAALGLTRDLADICCEWRQQNKIRHSLPNSSHPGYARSPWRTRTATT